MTDQTIATMADMRQAMPLAPQRFLDRLRPMPNGCWEWIAADNGLGYGRFNLHGNRLLYTHRLAYQWHYGAAIGRAVIRHRCDNPPCCNPAHLLLGTQRDNMADAIERGRWPDRKLTPNRGERCFNAILTEADVIAIRSDPRILRLIAADYGISIPTTHAVKARRIWRHL